MKKKLMVLLCVLTLTFGMVMTTHAEISPSGTPDKTETTDKEEKSPKTGEGAVVICGIAAAALFAGTAVVSKRKLAEIE